MKDLQSISELKRGDIIQSKASGVSYIVTSNYGDRATAVRTVDVTNPGEWKVLRKDKTTEPKPKPDLGYPASNPTGHFL